MSCENFVVGQRPRFSAQFRLGSVLTDPTLVKFIYKKPSASAPKIRWDESFLIRLAAAQSMRRGICFLLVY